MADRAVPSLPSRDFDATASFYAALGFEVALRLPDWMILRAGTIELEFFSFHELDPSASDFMCTLRLADIDEFCDRAVRAGVPEASAGIPRVVVPKDVPWGRVAWVIDEDGTQLNLIREAG